LVLSLLDRGAAYRKSGKSPVKDNERNSNDKFWNPDEDQKKAALKRGGGSM